MIKYMGLAVMKVVAILGLFLHIIVLALALLWQVILWVREDWDEIAPLGWLWLFGVMFLWAIEETKVTLTMDRSYVKTN